ncbi:PilN domain-containing protein [Candidatus Dependentiae bacterium]
MEKINFIDTEKLKKYQDMLQWLRLSAMLIGITITILSFISITQTRKLSNIKKVIKDQKKEIIHLDKVLKEKAKLKKQKKLLQNKLAHINKLKTSPKKEFDILLNIHKLFPKGANLQLISVNKNEITISAESTSDKLATKLSQKIAKLPYVKSAKLASMQKNNNKFMFQIKGKIKT